MHRRPLPSQVASGTSCFPPPLLFHTYPLGWQPLLCHPPQSASAPLQSQGRVHVKPHPQAPAPAELQHQHQHHSTSHHVRREGFCGPPVLPLPPPPTYTLPHPTTTKCKQSSGMASGRQAAPHPPPHHAALRPAPCPASHPHSSSRLCIRVSAGCSVRSMPTCTPFAVTSPPLPSIHGLAPQHTIRTSPHHPPTTQPSATLSALVQPPPAHAQDRSGTSTTLHPPSSSAPQLPPATASRHTATPPPPPPPLLPGA